MSSYKSKISFYFLGFFGWGDDICINDRENEKILKMDKIVIDKVLKESNQKEYKASELFNMTNRIFKSSSDIKDTCYRCKWYDVCTWAKSKK